VPTLPADQQAQATAYLNQASQDTQRLRYPPLPANGPGTTAGTAGPASPTPQQQMAEAQSHYDAAWKNAPPAFAGAREQIAQLAEQQAKQIESQHPGVQVDRTQLQAQIAAQVLPNLDNLLARSPQEDAVKNLRAAIATPEGKAAIANILDAGTKYQATHDLESTVTNGTPTPQRDLNTAGDNFMGQVDYYLKQDHSHDPSLTPQQQQQWQQAHDAMKQHIADAKKFGQEHNNQPPVSVVLAALCGQDRNGDGSAKFPALFETALEFQQAAARDMGINPGDITRQVSGQK
jgi:hypothetical protein